jgi:hypothetical protein
MQLPIQTPCLVTNMWQYCACLHNNHAFFKNIMESWQRILRQGRKIELGSQPIYVANIGNTVFHPIIYVAREIKFWKIC